MLKLIRNHVLEFLYVVFGQIISTLLGNAQWDNVTQGCSVIYLIACFKSYLYCRVEARCTSETYFCHFSVICLLAFSFKGFMIKCDCKLLYCKTYILCNGFIV
jgi:hypothetical protein